jgi:hypothetical protein
MTCILTDMTQIRRSFAPIHPFPNPRSQTIYESHVPTYIRDVRFPDLPLPRGQIRRSRARSLG